MGTETGLTAVAVFAGVLDVLSDTFFPSRLEAAASAADEVEGLGVGALLALRAGPAFEAPTGFPPFGFRAALDAALSDLFLPDVLLPEAALVGGPSAVLPPGERGVLGLWSVMVISIARSGGIGRI